MHILNNRTWKDCDEKIHFESGVHMGVGVFNLVCSQVYCLHFVYCMFAVWCCMLSSVILHSMIGIVVTNVTDVLIQLLFVFVIC